MIDSLNNTSNKNIPINNSTSSTHIEQTDKKNIEKSFYECDIFISIFIPLIVTILTFLAQRWWFRKKERNENKKLELDIAKATEDIITLKKSFQPIVLSTIQLTQQTLVNDKIEALKELAAFRYNLFNLDQDFVDGIPLIDDIYDYYQNIYQNLSESTIKEITTITLKKGYIFPNNINKNLNLIIYDIKEIYDISKKEMSKQSMEMPNDVKLKLDELSDKLNSVIDDIRLDLHIDNNYIHQFIEKYKNLD